MSYKNAYVGTISLGANYMHTIKTLLEAEAYPGPSIIIAYAPCIAHGIKTGMEHSLDDSKLATTCGYFLTFRYNPDEDKFTLDSKNIDSSKYDQFLSNENRYANLKKVNPDDANRLLELQKDWANKRYEYYSKLVN